MNKAIQMGRFTANPEIHRRNDKVMATFTVAVDRQYKNSEGERIADFHRCVAYGSTAEFIEKYMQKGTKVLLEAELHNDNYEKDGVKHYGYQLVVRSIEFAESKNSTSENKPSEAPASDDGFMNIPDGLEEELPFK